MEQAIKFEMERQAEILDANGIPPQETRGWDAKKGITFAQRTKEDAADYRYFPDPDLAPIRLTEDFIKNLKAELPELPVQICERWHKVFGVETRFSSLMFSLPNEAEWLEKLFVLAQNKNLDANKLAGSMVNKKFAFNIDDTPGEILEKFAALAQTDEVKDDDLLDAIKKVIANNSDALAKYKAGQTQLLNFFFGQTMRELGKKVDAAQLRKLLETELSK